MRSRLDLAQIFPMDDEASARLMMVKAACLHSAGVITEAEKLVVLERATAVILGCQAQRAA